jgi:hypothetical protein
MRRALLVCLLASLPTAALGCARTDVADSLKEEVSRREAYAKDTMTDAGAARAVGVSSTSEIQFDDGFGILSYDPPDEFRNHAFRWMGQNAHVRLKSHGAHRMKLLVVGWVHHKVIRTKPVINLFIDGQWVATSNVIQEGHYWIEVVVPPSLIHRPWVDLTIRTNAVGFHWGDPPELKVALVYRFGWTEAD